MPTTSFTLGVQPFPVGTTVGVYARQTLMGPAGPVGGVILTSAVTGADSETTFTGLEFGTDYWAAALVGDGWRSVAFRTAEDPVDTPATLADIAVLKEAPLNVRHPEYGAVGDGVANDTAALTAALAAVNGGRIYLPRGVYSVADVAVPDEGVTVLGDGLGTPGDGQGTILKARAGATYALKALGKRYLALRDLVIDGNDRAARGFLYEATASATGQSLEMTRVRFYRCTRGWHIGPGAGGVSQTDKNSLRLTDFFECDYGIYGEAVNSQETVLDNCDFGTTYVTSVHLIAGCLTMLGGQFQGFGAAGTKGIAVAGLNVGWVNLKDVIFEGPDYDVFGGPGFWPHDGLATEHVVFQGPVANVLVDEPNARMTARHTRFNEDFDPPVRGGGIISWNQAGGVLVLDQCDYGAPLVTGAVLPFVKKTLPWRTTVASATTISPPPGAEFIAVTGSTPITGITAQPDGARITLYFTSTAALNDGTNLLLAGNFTGGAERTMTLFCDGTNWREISRSAN